jgi:hypothetical protein
VEILNGLTNRIARFGLKLKPKIQLRPETKKDFITVVEKGGGGVVLLGNFVLHVVGRLAERFVLSCTRPMFRVAVVVVVSAPRVFCATASYRTGQCTGFVEKRFPALVENGGQKFPLLRSAPGVVGLAAWREQVSSSSFTFYRCRFVLLFLLLKLSCRLSSILSLDVVVSWHVHATTAGFFLSALCLCSPSVVADA